MAGRFETRDNEPVRGFGRALLLLIVVGALAGAAIVYTISRRGLSTRTAPTAVEARLALAMRSFATPQAARTRANPIEATPAVLEDGMAHFADHCATCHGNDGKGDTEMGRGLYPPAPDMRAARTQNLTDGELFSIIENGIRLTGMPAWGTGTKDSESSTWALVHFIRRLPTLRAEDVARMEDLNPKSPDEIRADDAARDFLSGKTSGAAAADHAEHAGHGEHAEHGDHAEHAEHGDHDGPRPKTPRK